MSLLLTFVGPIVVAVLGLVGVLAASRNDRVQANAEADLLTKLPDGPTAQLLRKVIDARVHRWHDAMYNKAAKPGMSPQPASLWHRTIRLWVLALFMLPFVVIYLYGVWWRFNHPYNP